MNVNDALGAMTERLEKKGWVKGQSWTYEMSPAANRGLPLAIGYGAACLQGTYSLITQDMVIDVVTLHAKVAERLAVAIIGLFPDRIDDRSTRTWNTVVRFNDHTDTTFEDVLLVVKHAREMETT